MKLCAACYNPVYPIPDKTKESIRYELPDSEGRLQFAGFMFPTKESTSNLFYLHDKMERKLIKPVLSNDLSSFSQWEEASSRSKKRASKAFKELEAKIFGRNPKLLDSSSKGI